MINYNWNDTGWYICEIYLDKGLKMFCFGGTNDVGTMTKSSGVSFNQDKKLFRGTGDTVNQKKLFSYYSL